MRSSPNPRAAIYARVSTIEQVDGTSLATQVERCRAHVAAQGWHGVGEWVDEGVSGAKASRPALDGLMRAVRASEVDVVVVAKLDRIGRSMRHLAALLGELDDRNVGLISVSESFDSSTPAGRLQRNMLGSFAEFEREQIRERVLGGLEASVRKGRWVGGPPPYGYRRDGVHLAIEESEAATLRLAVELLVEQRMSTGQVARELNARGMLPRKSERWSSLSLRQQLLAAVWLSGSWTWRRTTRPRKRRLPERSGPPVAVRVPPIVSVTQHERLQARLLETTTIRSGGRDYLLAGRIWSPHGETMYGVTMSTAVYRCAHTFTQVRTTRIDRCSCRTVRVEVADEIVWSEVSRVLGDPDRLMALAGAAADEAATAAQVTSGDLVAIDRRITRLERALGDRLAKALAAGVDPIVAQHAARTLTDDLETTRSQRARLVAWEAMNSDRADRRKRLGELASQAEATLRAADMATKRRVLDLLEVRVTVSGWSPCDTCGGKGLIPVKEPNARPRHVPGRKPKVCPSCHRHRWIPHLRIEGVVPDVSSLDKPIPAPGAAGWPFRIASTG